MRKYLDRKLMELAQHSKSKCYVITKVATKVVEKNYTRKLSRISSRWDW